MSSVFLLCDLSAVDSLKCLLYGLNLNLAHLKALVNHHTVERFASVTVLSRRSINRILGVLVTLEHCSLYR